MGDFRRRLMGQVSGGGDVGGKELEFIQTNGHLCILTDIPYPSPFYAIVSAKWADLPTGSAGTQQQYVLSFGTGQGVSQDWGDDAVMLRVQRDSVIVIYAYTYKHGAVNPRYYSLYHTGNWSTGGTGTISAKYSDNIVRFAFSKTFNPNSITALPTSNSYTNNRGLIVGNLTLMGDYYTKDSASRKMHNGGQFYGMRIYSDANYSNLTHNIVPYMIGSDVGVKDKITGKFYGPYSYDGQGILTPGPEV